MIGMGGGRITHFIKRILILYFFWFVVWLPWIIIEKELLHQSIIDSVLLLLHDFFFSYTFHGSWFLSGLLISVTIIWMLERLKLRPLVAILSLFCFGFLEGWYLDNLYAYCQIVLRPELTLTFISGLIWVGVGYFLAIPTAEICYSKIHPRYLMALFLAVYIVGTLIESSIFSAIGIIIIFVFFYCVPIKENPIYITLRKISIVIYIVHFIIVGFFAKVYPNPEVLSGPLYLVVVFTLSFSIGYVMIKLSEKPKFKWLKFAY